MQQMIQIFENGIHVVIEISDTGDVWLRHCSPLPYVPALIEPVDDVKYRLCEVQLAGYNQDDHHGSKHTGTLPGRQLRYERHSDTRSAAGRLLTVAMVGEGLRVTSCLQFFDGIAVIRSHTTVQNISEQPVGLEYVSSFCLTGLSKEGGDWEEDSRLWLCYNSWYGELQWRENTLPQLGLSHTNWASTQRIQKSVTGTWPTGECMPMGYYENTHSKAGWLWQIESNCSWCFEVGDLAKTLYVQLSGPSFQDNQWFQRLQPGEQFQTVPAAIAPGNQGMEHALQQMTLYRRALCHRPTADARLPVLFNDAICVDLDPTADKLLPYIDLAAKGGCEGFCIDAGWYARQDWWSEAGNWHADEARFPQGLRAVTDAIRERNLLPGLWLEPEVMGLNCALAGASDAMATAAAPLPGAAPEKKALKQHPSTEQTADAPEEWFFTRHGHRVMDHGRYQLDARHPDVRRFMHEAVDRCVQEYGAAYLKIDYNINAGPGTDQKSDSLGHGLLEHSRAVLGWLEKVTARHPQLVIENCASGGQRMDYATMSRCALASLTDQGDRYELAAIAAAAPSALPPEQCGIWVCPMSGDTDEEVVFSLVNAMLLRIHLSAPLSGLSERQLALLQEGIQVYQAVRQQIPHALPFWPLGLPGRRQDWLALGLRGNGHTYLAVWHVDGEDDTLRIPGTPGHAARILYPVDLPGAVSFTDDALQVSMPKRTARLIQIN